MPTALLFGAIGTVAETSDIQRRAFNRAFAEAGLDRQWDEETYRGLLSVVGGRNRLRRDAERRGVPLDEATVDRLHRRKTEATREIAMEEGIALRPGVAEVVADCLARNIPVGWVTTTTRSNLEMLAAAAGDALPLHRFSLVLTGADVPHPKPAPDAYRMALARLALTPRDAIAVEDTAASLASAVTAGIPTLATPGAFASDDDFGAATAMLPDLAHANPSGPVGFADLAGLVA